MPQYNAPVRDFKFLLKEWLQVEQYKDLPNFQDVDYNLIDSILNEGDRLCREVLLPLNQSGDQQGCRWDNQNVILPDGFIEAYKQYCAGGWPSFTCAKDFGGQALPEVVNMPIVEMICSANLSFGMIPALTHGAYNAIYKYGTQELKDIYLPKMVSGEWAGVMCLTEPHSGTDLGLITTKATPNDDGSYNITGNKIFISGGEQDATENIIHLVLAKLPDAPKGVKGISLFLVPKFNVNVDGSLGDRNQVFCGSIEHKMGIHASPTCVMNYEGAKGFLVGQPNKGLRAMFTMMNEARIYVGIQGLGLSEISYQNAAQYAKDRLQGRGLKGAKYPDKKADPIIVHPDVRRMLLSMKSCNEGARALALYTALKVDISKHHPDSNVRQEADDFIQLVTPMIKGFLTDMGFEMTNLGVQIFGGHGYIVEYGMEQYVRDARIAQLYEGANGIQALDLVGRKLPAHMGRYLRSFFHPVTKFLEENRDNKEMEPFNKPLYKAVDSMQKATLWIAAQGMANPDEAGAASYDYMNLCSLTVIGYMWALMAKTALENKDNADDQEFYEAKLATAKYYMEKILPQHYSLLATLTAGSKSVMSPAEEWF